MSSLQVRLFLSYFLIILVTLGLTALSLLVLLGDLRESRTYGNLEDVARLVDSQANSEIRNALQQGGEVPPGSDLLLVLRNFLGSRDPEDIPTDTSLAVTNRQGEVIAGLWASAGQLDGATLKGVDLPLASPQGQGRRPERCTLDLQGASDLVCIVIPLSGTVLAAFPGGEAAALVVGEPAASLGQVLGDLMPRLLFAGLIGVAAALILGFLLSQSVAAPLRSIARAARSVARGNYRQRVPAAGPREVRDLASTFNRMTEDVQRSQQTLRDFLANISHELKTPLTSIRGFSEALLDGTIEDEKGLQRSARVISDESNRLLRLVNELLDLSRIESGQTSMRQEDIALEELLEHIGEVFARRSEETGVQLEISGASTSRIRGDFDRLEQVLNNLLDNAFRHTPPGGLIRVSTRNPRPGVVQVSVSDNGPGIPADDVPHLFERFYRATSSGNGTGYGLGLAISREIVRAHGGEIWATSELRSGTIFSFTLPAAGRRRSLVKRA